VKSSNRSQLLCLLALALLTIPLLGSTCNLPFPPVDRPPNILFIILDDVGIDQLQIFNPSAPNPIPTPNIDAVAAAGIKFNNCYMMPECSPSRVCFFTGRWPLRTGVTAAFTDADLAAAQCSHYEATAPQVLHNANYKSALVGKFHVAGPTNNPDAYGAPAALGWDYYNGIMQGAPPFIDTSLGGQYTTDTTRYCWGFPFGDQRGAGWFMTHSGTVRCRDNFGLGFTGQQIAALGGIAALDANGNFAATCADAAGPPDFSVNSGYNGYYSMPNVVNENGQISQSTSRGYATILQTNTMIKWIKSQSRGFGAKDPWMATMSYSAIHTPYQPPPAELWPEGFVWPEGIPMDDCSNPDTIRVVSDLMVAAMDKEIGRLLVSTGLATRGLDGKLHYDPQATNTMIVIAGDNGTYYPSVEAPYDPLRAKGSCYQTGTLAPLIVAGPLVVEPGRTVSHMVNAADLFQLWGEIAGLDVRAIVPSSHTLDSRPMLAYLTDPNQPAIRETNFEQFGSGLKSPATQQQLGPCVLHVGPSLVCTDQLFDSENLCMAEGGDWYGPTSTGPAQYATCCDLASVSGFENMTIEPIAAWAIRNQRYKLIKFQRESCETSGEYEFYDLDNGLDTADKNLLVCCMPLTPEQQFNYDALLAEMNQVFDSEPACYADGNLDKQVNQDDVDGYNTYAGQESWFDVNHDGYTDQNDLNCINANLGTNCLNGTPGSQCP